MAVIGALRQLDLAAGSEADARRARRLQALERVLRLGTGLSVIPEVPQDAVVPVPIEYAKGVYMYTPDGERILDFNSQLMSVNIGHGDQLDRTIVNRQRVGGGTAPSTAPSSSRT